MTQQSINYYYMVDTNLSLFNVVSGLISFPY